MRALSHWFYDQEIWKTTSWNGVPAQKLPSDMWNYQEIITTLQPGLIVEFGRNYGGSTMFFASMLQLIPAPGSGVLSGRHG